MSKAEILQLTGAVLAAIASMLAAAEARLVKRFQKAGAISPEQAIVLPSLGRISRWRLARLRSVGAIVGTDGGMQYLVPQEYRGYRKKRRIRALCMVAILVGAVVLTMVTLN